MRKSLISVAVLLLSSYFGNAQDKPPIHVVIQVAPEQIKKAAVAVLARSGYSLDSDTTTQLKISKPFSEEETAAYSTAHWTNQPVANCQHVQTFLLSRADEGTSVTMTKEKVCHTDGMWLIRRDDDQKEIQWAQSILADLKVKIEEPNRRH